MGMVGTCPTYGFKSGSLKDPFNDLKYAGVGFGLDLPSGSQWPGANVPADNRAWLQKPGYNVSID
jgi:hypothetical protein